MCVVQSCPNLEILECSTRSEINCFHIETLSYVFNDFFQLRKLKLKWKKQDDHGTHNWRNFVRNKFEEIDNIYGKKFKVGCRGYSGFSIIISEVEST